MKSEKRQSAAKQKQTAGDAPPITAEAENAGPVEAPEDPEAVSADGRATGEKVTDGKHGSVSGFRNLSQRSAKKGGDKLEFSRSGKASRKSTRKSKGRLKRTTNLQLRAERKTCAPSSQAARNR
jgi:hypothetical protein